MISACETASDLAARFDRSDWEFELGFHPAPTSAFPNVFA